LKASLEEISQIAEEFGDTDEEDEDDDEEDDDE
jgi:hypothetical protein